MLMSSTNVTDLLSCLIIFMLKTYINHVNQDKNDDI